MQTVFPRCADNTCPSSLSARLKRDPFPSFALQKRPRSQLPAPGSSSTREKKIHQLSQQDIDNKPQLIRSGESLFQGGQVQVTPQLCTSQRGSASMPEGAGGRGRGFPLLLLQNERKEINTRCNAFTTTATTPPLPAPATAPPRRGARSSRLPPALPGSPQSPASRGGFPPGDCRGRSRPAHGAALPRPGWPRTPAARKRLGSGGAGDVTHWPSCPRGPRPVPPTQIRIAEVPSLQAAGTACFAGRLR